MKTQNKFFRLLLLIILTFALTNCSKNEAPPPPVQIVDTDKDGIADADDDCPNQAGPSSNQGCPVNEEGEIVESDGISEEDLETYQGAIGIVVDGRNIAKKGYTPKMAAITVDANSGNYSKEVELDPYSFMAQINLEMADLGEDAIKELTDGVQVVAEFFDASGVSIWTESLSKLSFKSNPLPVGVKANGLTDKKTDVVLNANTPYYIQRVNEDGTPLGSAVGKRITDNPEFDDLLTTTSNVQFTGDEDNLLFYFEQDENKNRYQIKHKGTGDYLRRVTRTTNSVDYFAIEAGYPSSGFLSQRFIFKKVKDGVYQVQDYEENTFQVRSGVGLTVFHPFEKEELYIRLIPMNIDWSIESIGTEYLTPILSPAQNGFNYNSTLINCGQGGLSQEIGSSKEVETITSVGWEETVSISSSYSASASLTLGMEVEGSFFGFGATYSAEASSSYEFTTTNTTDTSNWTEATGSTKETFFSTRTVTVPSKSASLVYDAFQTYENVKVNVVQRLRVKASEHNNSDNFLSGHQISTQFHFNGFNGVITLIGDDFIELTIRGVATMDKIFKSKSEVQEVDPNCGG